MIEVKQTFSITNPIHSIIALKRAKENFMKAYQVKQEILAGDNAKYFDMLSPKQQNHVLNEIAHAQHTTYFGTPFVGVTAMVSFEDIDDNFNYHYVNNFDRHCVDVTANEAELIHREVLKTWMYPADSSSDIIWVFRTPKHVKRLVRKIEVTGKNRTYCMAFPCEYTDAKDSIDNIRKYVLSVIKN